MSNHGNSNKINKLRQIALDIKKMTNLKKGKCSTSTKNWYRIPKHGNKSTNLSTTEGSKGIYKNYVL